MLIEQLLCARLVRGNENIAVNKTGQLPSPVEHSNSGASQTLNKQLIPC